MITKRIIPCLDVKNGRVVKGTNFQGLQDVSSPVELGKYYSSCGADDLFHRGSSRLRDQTHVFRIAGSFFTI